MENPSIIFSHVTPAEIDCSIAKSRLVFIHIPKTARTTFDRILKQVSQFQNKPRIRIPGTVYNQFLGDDKMETSAMLGQFKPTALANSSMLIGHVPLSVWDDYIDLEDSALTTLLRDPIDRMVSQYLFGIQKGGWSTATTMNDVVASGALVDNLQVRMLAGCTDPTQECSDHMLATATRNLAQKFAVIGSSENFNLFLAAMIKLYGWPEIIYQSYQVGQTKPSQPELSKIRDEAAKFNAYDIKLVDSMRAHGDVWINQVAPRPVTNKAANKDDQILLVSQSIGAETDEVPSIAQDELPNFIKVLEQQGADLVRFPVA